jgi:uncharacterized protein
MPVQTSYPGVYIEEIPSGVRTITGVATYITAFIGRTPMGPVGDPQVITSYSDFERMFGGIATGFTLGFAVRDFYLNGGSQGVVVRLLGTPAPPAAVAAPAPGPAPAPVAPAAPAVTAAAPAEIDLDGTKLDATGKEVKSTFKLLAASPGSWGGGLRVVVDYNTKEKPAAGKTRFTFNLTISQVDPVTGSTLKSETYLNVSRLPSDARYVQAVLNQNSTLATTSDDSSGVLPAATALDKTTGRPTPSAPDPQKGGGSDGGPLRDDDLVGPGMDANKQGLFSLEHVDLFNLLCIPPDDPNGDQSAAVLAAAADYCTQRRAMLIVDSPVAWTTMQQALDGFDAFTSPMASSRRNAVLFFPRIVEANPISDGQLQTFAPSGALAGIFARTDSLRGVWKAPAGINATFSGVSQMSVKLTDPENGNLNPLGINCLRTFPVIGPVVWGARTLAGADILEDDYKYLPVRRLALYIEESLYRGTQWVVFEPNDNPLWAQIRLNVGSFMQDLFRQGAFQGSTPTDAYFVKCDNETTTQNDINLGVVNIVVGFAPLKPAEFVIIQIEQMAGQIQV